MKSTTKSLVTALVLSLASTLGSGNLALAADAPGVVVDVKLSPTGSFKAKTSDVSGHAVVAGDKVTAENIVVKLDKLSTGIGLRDEHARDKYLEVAKFPEATLIKAVGQNGSGKAKIKIRGITKDVAGTYKIEGDSLNASFPISLADFGISGVKYLGVGVNDKVTINVAVPVKK